MKQGTLGHDSISLRRGSAIGGSPVACSSDPLIVEANQLRAERTGKRDKLWPELLIAINEVRFVGRQRHVAQAMRADQ